MTIDRDFCLQSDLPIPPGELLDEELTAIGMTRQQLARRVACPVQVIGEVIRGERPLTKELALEIEKVLGTPANLWINLQAQYQLAQARLLETEQR